MVRKTARVVGGALVLVAILLAIPPLVDFARTHVGSSKPATWNDVARRLAEFQKEQPGLAPAAQIEQPAPETKAAK